MAFSKVKVGGLADDSVTAANIDDDGTGYTVGNLTNSGTLQQTGQATFGSGGTNWTLPTARGTDKYVLQINGTTGAANWAESLTAPELSGHNFDVSGSTDDGRINAYEAPYTATGNTTNNSNSIASISITSSGDDINDLKVGQFVSGVGIPANTVIKSISGTTITLKDNTSGSDTNATATNTGTTLSIQKTPGEKNGGKVILTGTNFGNTIGELTVAITTAAGGVIANASYLSGLSGGTTITAEWTGTEGSYSTDLTSSYTGKIYFKMTKSGLSSNVLDTGVTLTTDGTLTTLSTSSQTGGDRSATPSATSLGTYGDGRTAGGGQESNTKLLLNFDRGGGTDFEDSSNTGGNGHKITANGNAVIKASPFGDGKSAIFFDGGEKVVVTDNADLDIGTSSYSIDCWFYLTSVEAAHNYLYDFGNSSGSKRITWAFYNSPSSWYGGSANASPTAFNITTGVWHHWAVCRDASDGNKYRIFLDGVLQQTVTDSTNYNDLSSWPIGDRYNHESTTNYLHGYIDEFRLVIGEALFTSNFTPSQYRYGTTGATHEVSTASNMKLLIHSDQEEDSSDSKHIITKYGGTVPNLGQTAYTGGNGAWKFDGTDGKLTTNKSPDFDFGTGDYTIEGQFYKTGTAATQVLLARHNTSDSEWYLRYESSGNNLNFWNGSDHSVAHDLADSGRDQWVHIAVVKIGTGSSNAKLYVNGVAKLTFTDNATYDSGEELQIGARNAGTNNWTQYYEGRAEDIRITKGLGIYTGNFTKPSGPLTTTWTQTGSGTPTSNGGYTSLTNIATNSDASKVKLLLHGDGAKFTDSATTGTTHTVTGTGAFHSQSITGIASAMTYPSNKKTTGSAGAYFDGNGDYLQVFNFSETLSNSWSFEFYFNLSEVGRNNGLFYMTDVSGSSGWLRLRVNTANKLALWADDNASGWGIANNQEGSAVFSPNTWYHLLFVHDTSPSTNTYKIFIDGSASADISVSSNTNIANTPDELFIGYTEDSSDYLKGYIDSFRWHSSALTAGTSAKPTSIYGGYGKETPDAGTITLTATGSDDYTWSEVAGGTALPGTLAVGSTTHSGSGNSRTHTATITGSFTKDTTSTFVNGARSDLATTGILLKAQNDTDATKAITLGSSGGYDGISITQKSTEKPVLFSGRRYYGNNVQGREVSGFGFDSSPDLVWIKSRSGGAHHNIYDTVRGVNANNGNKLIPNENRAQNDSVFGYGNIREFTRDGFTLESGSQGSTEHVNYDNRPYVAWTWKAGGVPGSDTLSLSGGVGAGTISSGLTNITNVTQSVNQNTGFSITKFRGAANGGSFPHNLGGSPSWVIIKAITNENSVGLQSWGVWHKNLSATSGKALFLDTGAIETSSDYFNYSGVDMGSNTTLISVGSNDTTGGGVCDYICYAWRAIPGLSAFGTYTGQQTGNPSVGDPTYCGFKPRMVILKKRDVSTGSWRMFDKFRQNDDAWGKNLNPDDPSDEANESNVSVTVYDNGFATGSDSAIANNNIIWMAFA